MDLYGVVGKSEYKNLLSDPQGADVIGVSLLPVPPSLHNRARSVRRCRKGARVLPSRHPAVPAQAGPG